MGSENIQGSPISIQWDKINGEDWILIKDQDEKLIMKVQKELWDGLDVCGFDSEIRDKIMTQIRKLYG